MKTKRFLSIALTLVMLLGMFPGMSLTAYAADTTTTITPGTDDAKTGTGTMTITLKIKAAQTITASDVTATYGDTDKSVSASVTEPTTGGGTITYAVKDGSGDYIDVAADGKLTIKKVPPTDGKAYVIVKAASTDDYAETTKEVTVTISKAEATVAAKDQGIMVGGTVPDLSAPVLNTHYSVTGLVGTDALTTAPTLAYQKNGSAATPDNTTAGTYDIVPSGASAGDNYAISYTKGTLTISEKQPATVTKVPTANSLIYTGSTQALVNEGSTNDGEMQYALGENATTAPAENLYTTSIPAKTDAGTYYVWYRVKGDLNHYDSEPRCVTVNIANALYTVTSVENWEHTIDYPNDIIITVKRNAADNITYSMYTGASVDGNGIPADGSSVAQGSLILTLKGSYLDTLSTGTHKVTISFKDGSADATISIVNAPPAPTAAPTHVPKTGDGANLVLWIGLILLGFLGIIAFAGMAGRKHRNR